MKDAKGHGSDPRGAHNAGIDTIGAVRTVPISKVYPTELLNMYETDPTVEYFRQKIRNGEEVPPIQIDTDNNIVNGHHRYTAYIKEGAKRVPVSNQDYTFASDRLRSQNENG